MNDRFPPKADLQRVRFLPRRLTGFTRPTAASV